MHELLLFTAHLSGDISFEKLTALFLLTYDDCFHKVQYSVSQRVRTALLLNPNHLLNFDEITLNVLVVL